MTGKQLRYRLEAATLWLPLAFFRLLGHDRAGAFGGWLGRSLGPKLGISRRARKNITYAMPELSANDIEPIVEGMWSNLGQTISEYAFLEEFRKPEEASRIELQGAELLEEVNQRGKGGIFVSGHFANWELMPLVMQLNGYEGGEVYRHANNPYVNDWMVALRERAIGTVQIPKGATGARQIVRLLRDNKFIAMLVDQKMNDGIEARLFNQPAMTTAAPAGLAVRYGAPLIPAHFIRKEGSNFLLRVYEPIYAEEGAEPFAEIMRLTQALNDFLEARIRECPSQWLWVHNRWKK
jgi:KDO2-lipid IV(A) lauroyltransferase